MSTGCRTVVISPHLDDAVLSACHVLLSQPCTVLTVFAGPPDSSDLLTTWDLLTGAATSIQRHRERLDEDDRALASVGALACRLAEPEELYRSGPVDIARCIEAVAQELSGIEEVWIPLGFGRHADHLLAREIGICAAAAALVPRPGFYADYPYVIEYDWPTWVTGFPAQPYLNSDGWMTVQLRSLGLAAIDAQPYVARLSADERLRKQQAMAEYRSQMPALRLDPQSLDAVPYALDYELRWTVSASQLPRIMPPGPDPL